MFFLCKLQVFFFGTFNNILLLNDMKYKVRSIADLQ